jgi:hypothetical protein
LPPPQIPPGRPWNWAFEFAKLQRKPPSLALGETAMPANGSKFPYLNAVAKAIDQLGFDIEADAKKIVEQDVAALSAQRETVMAKARAKLAQRQTMLTDLGKALDALDMALGDNSSNPTS